MYLRRNGKSVDGEKYGYWTLVESVRTARGPRQRIVATIGKLPGLDKEERIGWEEIGRILTGTPHQGDIFEQPEEPPSWATVDINRVSIERLRCFGGIYLALLLWNKLGFADFCREHMPEGKEEIPWSMMACLLSVARFCAPSSELQIAESWYGKTALDDLLGIPQESVNDDRLYRALDALLPHKDALCKHLQDRYGELFGETFDFLFYDITSTYFEGMALGNSQAKRGYSRDSRPDCPQVCIGLVTSKEGLPLAFEIFDGNRADVTTTEEMVLIMEGKYGKANRIWVMDRGMVSEENIEFLKGRKAKYIVGTPKSMLKKFERELLSQGWEEVHCGVEVKLCASPEGADETFVLCRSEGRKDKEAAILNRFIVRLEAALTKLKDQADQGKLRDRQKAERRIGRLLERNSRAASLFDVTVTETGAGKNKRLSVKIIKNEERYQWALQSGGNYILRTNWKEADPKTIWKRYIQLTEVEDAFRTEKHDLGMRPIYHRKQDRTQAHILVCFLSLAMWRTLQQWMKASGLGTAPRKLIEEIREVRSLDVVLPTKDKTIRLRVVSTPPKELKVLLQRLKIQLPNRPKIIENAENVVDKIACLQI
ncbi:MAG TPA: IS1634 family transposase [Nitrospiraceae bacterium]|jgi:transposase|nr:IS1634 family transposase [Nitrospiraceae bacterium]